MTASNRVDVIVVGSGGIGGAIVYHLARSGKKVLGIDRFHPPHGRGSSHGSTRLIRKAYFENPHYIPLLKRSDALWDELAQKAGKRLLHQTGFLMLSDAKSATALKTEENSRFHRVPLEKLDRRAIGMRFPQFQVPDEIHGLFENGAGYLAVEQCVETHIALARLEGANFAFDECVEQWRADASEVCVRTDKGSYSAQTLVLAPGAWSPALLKEFGMALTIKRGVQFWFAGQPEHEEKNGMPCFAFALGGDFIYGFPLVEDLGLKVADYKPSGVVQDPLWQNPRYSAEELEPVARYLKRFLPGVKALPISFTPCLYTLTKDENFVIDKHPRHSNVFLAVGDSGHAFKFAPVLGEIVAAMVDGKAPAFDLKFLSYRPDSSLT